ncbi:MAG: UDP-N-acetylenolpyruvoylglucosamine reductase, partial [Acidaminococcaceae bacterium]
LDLPNAGSMFKRPVGNYAGTLIETTGLKGYQVGGAQVSTKHAGFVVNVGDATAADVLQLISEVQNKVLAASGVWLEPEVRVFGE